jgi:hypothetical protein
MSRLVTAAGDQIVVTAAASIDTLAEVTYMAWVKLDSLPVAYSSILVKDPGNTYKGFWVTNAGALVGSYPFPKASFSVVSVIGTGAWTHVAMRFSNSGDKKIDLFIAGVEVIYDSQLAGSNPSDNGDAVYIGNDTFSTPLLGRIFDVRIYDAALIDADILTIKEGGPTVDPQPSNLKCQLTFETDQGSTEPDASGNGNVGVITGATFSSENPIFVGPTTIGTVFPGPYRGDTLQEAFSNRSGEDILQIVNQGGSVIWNLDADGVATDNPNDATPYAVLARFQGETFAEVFENPYSKNILQVFNRGGDIIFYVDFEGRASVV